jgi:hypothetical protein
MSSRSAYFYFVVNWAIEWTHLFYNGSADTGFNYNNCTDFGSGGYDVGAPDDLANNATACCTYCCTPGGD